MPLSLVLLLLLAGCNESPTEPGGVGDAALSGTVAYAENGAPAAGVRVVASQAWPGIARAEVLADASGIYRVLGVPPGNYTLFVYPPESAELALIRDVSIGSGMNTFDLQISANRCATISGTVSARSPRVPIAGATVRFGDQVVTTGADGRYVLELGCPPPDAGRTRPWSVSHPDFAPREFMMNVPGYSVTRDVTLDAP